VAKERKEAQLMNSSQSSDDDKPNSAQKPTKPSLSFRDGLEELETITKSLEADEIGLDEAIAHFERGSILAGQLQEQLREAQIKIEQIKLRFDTTAESSKLTIK